MHNPNDPRLSEELFREELLNHTRITLGDFHFYFHSSMSLFAIDEVLEESPALNPHHRLMELADFVINYRTHEVLKNRFF